MFGTPVNTGLTLPKVIGGLSKTLSIANQVIPLYKEAKPILNNAKTIFKVLKTINTPSKKSTTNLINKPKKEENKLNHSSNTPTFFL